MNEKLLLRIFFVVVLRTAVCCYVVAPYLGSNRIFKILNTKPGLMKNAYLLSEIGQDEKHLALGQDIQFPVWTSQSLNTEKILQY